MPRCVLDVASGTIEVDADSAPPPTTSFVEAASRRPEKLRIAISTKIPPPLAGTARPRAAAGVRGGRGAPTHAWPRCGRGRSRLRPRVAGLHHPLAARYPRRCRSDAPPGTARAAHARYGTNGRGDPAGAAAACACQRGPQRRPHQCPLRQLRRPDDPGPGDAATADRQVARPRRRAHVQRRRALCPVQQRLEPSRQSGRVGCRSPGLRLECRWRCSWSGVRTTRRRCWRSRRRSRTSCDGRIGARPWPRSDRGR